MIEEFGFKYSQGSWTHPDHPACVVSLRMDQFVVTSDNSHEQLVCAAFIHKNIAAVILASCAKQIAILSAIGYEQCDNDFHWHLCAAITPRVLFTTRNGPKIALFYDVFHQAVRYIVDGPEGGQVGQFDDMLALLPPVYAKYLSVAI